MQSPGSRNWHFDAFRLYKAGFQGETLSRTGSWSGRAYRQTRATIQLLLPERRISLNLFESLLNGTKRHPYGLA